MPLVAPLSVLFDPRRTQCFRSWHDAARLWVVGMSESGQCVAWLEKGSDERLNIGSNCSIGRSPSNDLVLNDERVSRRHATIHAQGEQEYWLVDLGSSNGTYLNGRRLAQPAQLHSGDTIQVGPFAARFFMTGGASGASAPTVSGQTIREIRSVPCWLLVADIEGSTRLAQQLAPEAFPAIIGRWFSDCGQVLEESSGTINKYLGDGWLAYWAPTQPAAGPLLGALARLRQLQDRARPPFRIVLHQGPILMGGAPSLGEESLAGAEVSFVFRMEKLAGSLGAPRLMSAAAHDLLSGKLETAELGSHLLPGFDRPQRFFGF